VSLVYQNDFASNRREERDSPAPNETPQKCPKISNFLWQ
jgi:hypothetical protein